MTTNTRSMEWAAGGALGSRQPAAGSEEWLAELDGPGIIALLKAGLGRLAGEVLVGDSSTLRDGIKGLAQVESMAAAERLRRVRAADEASDGRTSVMTELADDLGLSRGQARQEATTARELGRLPGVAGKLAAGELSLSQAHQVARKAAEFDQLAPGGVSGEALADLDDTITAGQGPVPAVRLRGELDAWGHRTAIEAIEAKEARQRALRTGSVRSASDGMIEVHARLAPAFGGAEFRTAIDALSRPGVDDDRSYPQRVADALTEIARLALARDGIPAVQGHRATVLLVVPPETAEGRPGAAPGHLDGVGDVSPAVARRIICDAEISEVTISRNGDVLDAGRARRQPSGRQRAAVIARDRACVGCGASVASCQLHHIRWWRDGGRTDLDNLVLLCWACHTAVHHDGWEVWRQPDGRYRAGPPARRQATRPHRRRRTACSNHPV